MRRLRNRVLGILEMNFLDPVLGFLRGRVPRCHRYRKPGIPRRERDRAAGKTKAENQQPLHQAPDP